MTQLKLIRDVFAEDFTLGQLMTGPVKFFTLEDRFREIHGKPVSTWKVPGMTAIPAGNYRVIIDFSNRFQKHLPHILDVPGFEGVRIHSGNTSADTEGCILLGLARDTKRGVITKSRDAMGLFMPWLQNAISHGEVWLQIV